MIWKNSSTSNSGIFFSLAELTWEAAVVPAIAVVISHILQEGSGELSAVSCRAIQFAPAVLRAGKALYF